MNSLSERTYRIGPLAIAATMEAGPAADVIDATLGLYDVVWPAADVDRSVCIDVTDASLPGPLGVVGEYLEAANMLVDRTAGGLRASTLGGATATGSFGILLDRTVSRGDWTSRLDFGQAAGRTRSRIS